MPRQREVMTPEQVLDSLRAKGWTEEKIAAVKSAMKVGEERGRIFDAEVERLKDQRLALRLTKDWVVRDRSADGGVIDNTRTGRRVMLTVSRENDKEVWLHASISRRDKNLPTYDDLQMVHREFMAGLVAYQVFVPESEHVNLHEGVLHLWACLTKRVTPDFTAGTGSI